MRHRALLRAGGHRGGQRLRVHRARRRCLGVRHGIKLHFIRPGHPVENANIESFNGKFRDECLNENWFIGIGDAREKIASYRTDYNEVRPDSSLDNLTPKEFTRSFTEPTLATEEGA